MLRQNQKCNYLGCDFLYMGESDDGIVLKPLVKHLSDVVVPYSRKAQIKIGAYQSSKR